MPAKLLRTRPRPPNVEAEMLLLLTNEIKRDTSVNKTCHVALLRTPDGKQKGYQEIPGSRLHYWLRADSSAQLAGPRLVASTIIWLCSGFYTDAGVC